MCGIGYVEFQPGAGYRCLTYYVWAADEGFREAGTAGFGKHSYVGRMKIYNHRYDS